MMTLVMNLSLSTSAAAVLQFLVMAASGAESTIPARLSRTNLLVYSTKPGTVAPVETRAEWKRRRSEILRGMQDITGPLPGEQKRCPLDVKIEAELDEGAFVRRFMTYASEPGSRVPAWLLIPKQALHSRRRFPAILALHPTDMEYGNRVIVELLRPQYPPYARELAERGFVVIAPAYPLMANYQPDLKALGYQSGTMKAIWDNIRALDLLETLPFVMKRQFGALGHSLGGHNAIFTAVFDRRLKVVVSSCGFDSFLDYMDGNIDGWTSERYMPRLAQFRTHLTDIPFDFYELIGALAPRPVFISAPLHDGNFKSASVDRIVDAAMPIYGLYGVSGNLRVIHPDCGHELPPQIRQEAYHFLADALR
jgi:prolyl oligopeptidase family protein